MNAHAAATGFEPTAGWHRICASVNAWRGGCLQHFGAVEAATTETLLVLSLVPQRGDRVGLRHLNGQRMADLAILVAPDGAFAAEGGGVAKALAGFRAHEPLRAFMAHGQAKLAVGRNGKWVAVFRYVSIKAGRGERAVLVVEEDEAEVQLRALRQSADRLCGMLASFRRTISA